MASSDGLRISKGVLGAFATILVAVAGIAATYAGELSSRIGSLERSQAANAVEQRNTQQQLSRIESILEKMRDDQFNRP